MRFDIKKLNKIIYLCVFTVLLSSCGGGATSLETRIQTVSETYPVVTETESDALSTWIGENQGIVLHSTVYLEMAALSGSGIEKAQLDAMSFVASTGDFSFLQSAVVYIVGSGKSVFVGKAAREHLSPDKKSLKIQTAPNVELGAILNKPFAFKLEITGERPTGNVNVYSELTFNATVKL